MLTLTYPGDWLTVAPTSEAVTEHFATLAKRYQPAWGEELIGPWKKEFQRRGAPHLHISTTPPMRFTTITDPATGRHREVDFKTWLSITWTDIVDHPDPEERRKHLLAGTGVDYAEGIKITDPRRMAVYFAEYGTGGSKEYQHRVPPEWLDSYLVCEECGRDYDQARDECPDCGCFDAELVELGSAGRFWGYCAGGIAPRASLSASADSGSTSTPAASPPAPPPSARSSSRPTAASSLSTTVRQSPPSSPAV